ncbi:carbon-nitrogen hydrolase family protein [Picrophilus oshimae]|uniref:Carbon-nitrogen hydrolase n=1 Tax=Picrophilus torridus (strain ATCC 700027 / DSM 9790 / JCM 10055 / NBRC 100828 / KAW 2/3) TaxID=1122961 RepID=Q6KZW3_PICTO|nr:carbon-nitrogen hydrolase family protein [Picrophilus oshimae]AAT43739.1 carbon-nitrogen hydrolase [Picrophilus oshimae DSM 9789]SMD31364.1 Carbon-nitrogen hydrolase [Picrophilus oshimae DSM 9789]
MIIKGIQAQRMNYKDAVKYLNDLCFDSDITLMPEKWITERLNNENIENIINILIEKSRNKTIVPGSFSFIDEKLFNRSYIISDGALIGYQDKINLYMGESIYYNPGNKINVFETMHGKIGIAICYDLDFPYYAKILIKKGASLILNPSLIRYEFHNEWHLYVESRSLENRIPVISVNSVSDDFKGDSIAAVPYKYKYGVKIKTFCEKNRDLIIDLKDILYDEIKKRINEDNGIYDFIPP